MDIDVDAGEGSFVFHSDFTVILAFSIAIGVSKDFPSAFKDLSFIVTVFISGGHDALLLLVSVDTAELNSGVGQRSDAVLLVDGTAHDTVAGHVNLHGIRRSGFTFSIQSSNLEVVTSHVVGKAFNSVFCFSDRLLVDFHTVFVEVVAKEGTVGFPAELGSIAGIELVVSHSEAVDGIDVGGEAGDNAFGDAASVTGIDLDEIGLVVFKFHNKSAVHKLVGPVNQHIGRRILGAQKDLHLFGVVADFPFNENRSTDINGAVNRTCNHSRFRSDNIALGDAHREAHGGGSDGNIVSASRNKQVLNHRVAIAALGLVAIQEALSS